MHEIHQHLKTSGEKLDTDIAEAKGIPLDKTREYLSVLSASGDVMFCRSIRFVGENKTECMSNRIAGYIVKNKPGAKSQG